MLKIPFLKSAYFSLFIVLMFYAWQINYGKEPYTQQAPDGWYNLLTDGLLQGKLSLPIEPKKELLALEDPYDPIQNGPFRLHDMSLYKDKYYMYFGITPAILVYLPYRLITGEKIKDESVILFFMFGVLIFSTLILKHFQKYFFQNISEIKISFSIFVIGICNITYQLLKRPMMYEVAISSGAFLLLGGIFFLIKYLTNKNQFMLFFAGLFLSLSAGCRPQFIIPGLLTLLFLILKLTPKSLSYFLFPYFSCLFLIGLYNYMRFDNFFEFGIHYQLPGFNIQKVQIMNPKFVLPGLYYYLFQAPGLNADLPFFHMMPKAIPYIPINKMYNIEGVFGLFLGIPFILTLIIAPILFFAEQTGAIKKNNLKFPTIEFNLIFIPACINLVFLTFAAGVTIRFLADFTTLFLLSACIVWFYFESILPLQSSKKILNIFILSTGVLSIIIGLAIGTEAYFNKLKIENYLLYSDIDSFCKPLKEIITKL